MWSQIPAGMESLLAQKICPYVRSFSWIRSALICCKKELDSFSAYLVNFWIVRIAVSSSAEKALGMRLDEHETSPIGTGTKNAKWWLDHSARHESFLIWPIFECNFSLRMVKVSITFNFMGFFLWSEAIRVDPTRTGGPSWSGPTFVPAWWGRHLFTNFDVKFVLISKFVNHRKKEPFFSPANKALVGTLITVGDVIDIFPIKIAVKAKNVLLWAIK